MMVLKDEMRVRILFQIGTVDLFAGILSLTEGTDIEVIVKNGLHRNNRPDGFHFPFVFVTGGFHAFPFRHARRRDSFVRQMIGDFLISPSVNREFENLPDNLRFGRNDFKRLMLVHDVAVRCCTDPLAVFLPSADDRTDLFGRIGNGHFVDEKLELDFQPVVVVRKVNIVPDGNDADTGVAQVFEFDQSAGIAACKTGEILDDEDVDLA